MHFRGSQRVTGGLRDVSRDLIGVQEGSLESLERSILLKRSWDPCNSFDMPLNAFEFQNTRKPSKPLGMPLEVTLEMFLETPCTILLKSTSNHRYPFEMFLKPLRRFLKLPETNLKTL